MNNNEHRQQGSLSLPPSLPTLSLSLPLSLSRSHNSVSPSLSYSSPLLYSLSLSILPLRSLAPSLPCSLCPSPPLPPSPSPPPSPWALWLTHTEFGFSLCPSATPLSPLLSPL